MRAGNTGSSESCKFDHVSDHVERAVETHSDTTEGDLTCGHAHSQHLTNATSDPPPLSRTPDFNSSPTTRSESTTTLLAPPTNNSLTPTSSSITSKVQAQPSPATPEIDYTTISRNQTNLVMNQLDLRKDLILKGVQTEVVVEIMTLFHSRARLNSTDGSPEAIVEQRRPDTSHAGSRRTSRPLAAVVVKQS